jgi:acetyl esterase
VIRICCLNLLLSFLLAGFGWAETNTPNSPIPPDTNEVTPLTLPGAESSVFKKVGDVELRLHVVKPKDWKSTDKRACLVTFFGGGWTSGTPARSITYAKWAAKNGLVGVAPDYRTRNRFNTQPEDCAADGRAAVRWIQDHAVELGVDPAKIVVQGSSAGGHVAAWTAIPDAVTPDAASDPVPNPVPMGLILLWPVTDTGANGYGGPKRFGNDEARANNLSVTGRMPAKMPPTLVFHDRGGEPEVSGENGAGKQRTGIGRCEGDGQRRRGVVFCSDSFVF